ncbi:protein of unknown function [Acidithiobacillus ferrivorans]|uniref:Uncharacterized protein n=1 Tax=Acidithiobacillus ferrivorans TaxID=160808 RepID=A0A060UWS1_9PROT|nr:hypothetical protein AFERRI_530098 [Acidithiobacillus ferrivorans]SMH67564.1 protein of unknown function [Acidithiobacillus ferrivorans]
MLSHQLRRGAWITSAKRPVPLRNPVWSSAQLKMLPEPQLELEDPRIPLPVIRHHHERFDFTLKICADPERSDYLPRE